MKNRRIKCVVTGQAHGKLKEAAARLGVPTSTLAALILEGVAQGYSKKLGFTVREKSRTRVFHFRAGSGWA